MLKNSQAFALIFSLSACVYIFLYLLIENISMEMNVVSSIIFAILLYTPIRNRLDARYNKKGEKLHENIRKKRVQTKRVRKRKI